MTFVLLLAVKKLFSLFVLVWRRPALKIKNQER